MGCNLLFRNKGCLCQGCHFPFHCDWLSSSVQWRAVKPALSATQRSQTSNSRLTAVMPSQAAPGHLLRICGFEVSNFGPYQLRMFWNTYYKQHDLKSFQKPFCMMFCFFLLCFHSFPCSIKATELELHNPSQSTSSSYSHLSFVCNAMSADWYNCIITLFSQKQHRNVAFQSNQISLSLNYSLCVYDIYFLLGEV